MAEFRSTFAYKLIYIFRINDGKHNGLLKIGEATCKSAKSAEELLPNSKELNVAAKNRINQYTTTAGIVYELLHTELAILTVDDESVKKIKAFSDHHVHKVLERSGIQRHYFDTQNKANEWFKTDLETAKRAITAVKENRASLLANEITEEHSPIIFRPEQKKAISDTIKQFKKSDRMLWNAKMRFGKTLTALQVAKELGFEKTIILTHRPVVNKGWYEDFQKIFYDTDYVYGSKTNGEKIENLVDSGKKFVYFASIQDLRGSEAVGGKHEKNEFVFLTEWDFVVIDEAHEGTLTKLGQAVIDQICNQTKKPKILRLSGTPFNLLDQFKEDEIYTWDYVMEQRAKHAWDKLHLGDSNPYASLPEMQIYTYDLNKLITGYFDEEDSAFNFREFFRTWTGVMEKDFKPMPVGAKVGDFVHEADVNAFLNLLCKGDKNSNYPYSTEEYRNYFRHSLWMLPGVKEARALSNLLNKHPAFGSGVFKIVNVAGDGDADEESKDALERVQKAFGDNPAETYTITLSCGRLTTGVSVPEWTAVFMLAGSFSTSASSYLQTIFRVQTPANINGQVKDICCVFDFAPDRTLKMVAEAGKLSAKAGDTSSDRVLMGEFLNFCPVIGIEGSKMSKYDVDNLLQQLKRAYTDRVVRNGFDDPHIYNDNLLKLDQIELGDFENLKKIIGASKQTKKQGDIDVNRQGLTNEEYEELGRIEKIPKNERTPEQLEKLQKHAEQRKNAETARSILRGISIRIPLLVYGANVPFDKEITSKNFTDLIDDASWLEFMPKGVDKPTFKKFAKYYEQDVFIAAGRQIRNKAKAADSLSPTERVKRIAEIFATFKNPDKETVLTPWRVVNMHLGDCLGGYDFYDESHEELLEEPRFRDNGKVTADTVANVNAQILEINSKSGLYPLYVVYCIYRKRCSLLPPNELTFEKQIELWDKTVAENVYVICKTKMARTITERTLLGYRKGKINAHAFDDLLMQIKDKSEQLIEKISRGSFWNKGVESMKFNAIVGNPPYQINDGSGASDDSANPIYNVFVEVATRLNANYVSMIMPAKWLVGGKPILKQFRRNFTSTNKIEKFFDFEDAKECFPAQHLDGGLCYFLFNEYYSGKVEYTYKPIGGKSFTIKRDIKDDKNSIIVRDFRRMSLINKVSSEDNFTKIVSLTQPFGIRKDLFNNPDKYLDFGYSEYDFNGAVKVYGVKGIKGGAKRQVGFLDKKSIIKNRSAIDKFKLFFTTSYSTNAIIPPAIICAGHGEICTETFLMVGPFNFEEEMKNCYTYMHTSFFRILLYFGKGTMQVNKDVFAYIPLQDFSDNSDIDWSVPIAEIDKQLYAKYGLTNDEIAFIESMIKPME